MHAHTTLRSDTVVVAEAPLSPLVSASARDGIDHLLKSVRVHLGMDVAFISEFTGDRRYFRHVDGKAPELPIKVGDSMLLDDGYCKKVVDGELPELIADTADVPGAMAIPATEALPIGSHISVPLKLSDGSLFGTFCCFSHVADPSLNQRDLNVMKTFAALVSNHIEGDLARNQKYLAARQRVEAILRSPHALDVVYQPIVCLKTLQILGAEALARFPLEASASPGAVFADASVAGLKTELECKAMARALRSFGNAWESSDIYLALNCSPLTVMETDWTSLLNDMPAHRVYLEITEQDHVEDYERFTEALLRLRALGVKVSIDDAGSGYASMRHILNIKPDIMKLDISLTRSIDTDRSRQALAQALIVFANQVGTRVVATGIETVAEMRMLSQLGAHAGQGFFLGRPQAADSFCDLVRRTNQKDTQKSA